MKTVLHLSQIPQMADGASICRWYPTPEQLSILGTLYRKGIRTLSGAQIRVIASYLSFFGRVEPKNVFYWFQNRKARDRKKLRQFLRLQHNILSSFAAVAETTAATHDDVEQRPLHQDLNYHHAENTINQFFTCLFGVQYFHNYAPILHQQHGETFSDSQGGDETITQLVTNNVSSELDASSQITQLENQPTDIINGSGDRDQWIKIINLGASARPLHTLELFPMKNMHEN